MKPSFREALQQLINSYSMENGSDTPDHILAEYLTDCLKAFDKATNSRNKWYQYPTLEESLLGRLEQVRLDRESKSE